MSRTHRVVRVSVRPDQLGRCSICGEFAEIKRGSRFGRHVDLDTAYTNAGLCALCRGSGQVGEMAGDCPQCKDSSRPGKLT